MKKTIIKSLELIKPFLVRIFETESLIAKKWAAAAHKRLFQVTWGIPNNPEFFDHQIDLFYLWQNTRASFWVERGVFSSLALKRGGNVLELACGDGFNTKNFYSALVKKIVACDFDKSAIATAKRKNQAENISFILADIRSQMPEGKYDNIVWDAAIEHFTEEEIDALMKNIKTKLKSDGILSGYTIVERSDGKSLSQHEYEFKSMEDLKRFFTPFFKNVTVFETIHPQRHNLYFWASDGILPFQENWEHCIKCNEK